MSAVSMAATRDSSASISSPVRVSIASRVRRAIALSGNVSLIVGSATGLFQVHPELLADRFPFRVTAFGIGVTGIGLMALLDGIVTGLALRRTRALLRFAVAMFVMIAGLIVSQIIVGIGFRQPLRDVLVGFNSEQIIVQVGLGTLGVLIGIQTGRSTLIPTPATPAPAPAARSTRRQSQQRRRSQPRHRPIPATASAESSTPAVQLVSPRPQPKPKLRRRWFSGKRVHLGKEKISVCPYCLDEVKPHDPRGKVVCKDCGTPHHADCWAITGKCEVPHLHT